ncbi:MAG: hypothetical protein ACI4QD_08585 [Kiritimatiellia bacterium]
MMNKSGKAGQTMIEYLIVLIILLFAGGVFAIFLQTVRQQSNRTLDLVASDYP